MTPQSQKLRYYSRGKKKPDARGTPSVEVVRTAVFIPADFTVTRVRSVTLSDAVYPVENSLGVLGRIAAATYGILDPSLPPGPQKRSGYARKAAESATGHVIRKDRSDDLVDGNRRALRRRRLRKPARW